MMIMWTNMWVCAGRSAPPDASAVLIGNKVDLLATPESRAEHLRTAEALLKVRVSPWYELGVLHPFMS